MTDAKIGQLGPETRKRLQEILEKFNLEDLFPRDKVVEVKHGRIVPVPKSDGPDRICVATGP